MLSNTIRSAVRRPAVATLAALVLASSAIVGTTAGVMAAKAVPTVDVLTCTSTPGASWDYYAVDYRFLANGGPMKGGWVHVEATGVADNIVGESNLFDPDDYGRVKARGTHTVQHLVPAGGADVSVKFQVVNRKGDPLVAPEDAPSFRLTNATCPQS